jgi:hypothetical protein
MLILRNVQQTMQKADLLRRLREGKLPAPNKDN